MTNLVCKALGLDSSSAIAIRFSSIISDDSSIYSSLQHVIVDSGQLLIVGLKRKLEISFLQFFSKLFDLHISALVRVHGEFVQPVVVL